MSTLHLRENNTLEIKVKLSEEGTLRFLGDGGKEVLLKIESGTLLPELETIKVNGTEIKFRDDILWKADTTIVMDREEHKVFLKVLKDVRLNDETFCAEQYSACYPYDELDGIVVCDCKVKDYVNVLEGCDSLPCPTGKPELKIEWNEDAVVANKHGVVLRSCQTVMKDSYHFFGEVLECDFIEEGTVIEVPANEYKVMEG